MTDSKDFSPHLHSHLLPASASQSQTYTWEKPSLPPFDELLLSWNAQRPSCGHYVILVSVYSSDWSPWLLYAVWGNLYQYSFHDHALAGSVQSFQDQVQVLKGQPATGFRLRIEARQGASLALFHTLHTCTSHVASFKCSSYPTPSFSSIQLSVPGVSQLCLNHPRATSFCSPTSTTAAIRYLLAHDRLNPLSFTEKVYDAGFDIYGNWSFNVAQAFVELGSTRPCFYARLAGFDSLFSYLQQGLPVIVSVKGQLTGSLMSYTNGHLLVVRGYEASTRRVLCMDPAFPTDEQTHQAYDLDEFMQAWGQRYYLAYLFGRKCERSRNPTDFPSTI
jgi:hypothetical protein